MLDRLGNEMETIQEGVQGLVVMEDSLKGEGKTQFVHFTWTATCHSFSVSSYFRTVSQTLPPYDEGIIFEGMRKVVGGNGPGTPDGIAPYAVGAFDFFTEDIGTMLSADATENERFEAALFTFIKPAKMYDTAHDALKTGEKAKDAGKGIVNPLLPGEGKVGTYEELIDEGTRGDNITPHHMPSAKYLKTKAEVQKNDGVSMNMEQPHPGKGGRHRQTETYGITGKKLEDYLILEPRDALARDIIDAKNIYIKEGLYTPEIRSGLLEIINLNKTKYPNIFER
ncbi:hypothetical protein MKZ26_17795 [Sporosarcina sp. FSL K6-6792]|uniref:hypothetical protein n=1 Tax=Sporosarcina sp. FSL K6-6792 TaxID=2921559 RepID=UPI0030F8A683